MESSDKTECRWRICHSILILLNNLLIQCSDSIPVSRGAGVDIKEPCKIKINNTKLSSKSLTEGSLGNHTVGEGEGSLKTGSLEVLVSIQQGCGSRH